MWSDLVEAGLDVKEAKLYLAVLSMDSPTIAQAAEACGVSRTNAYDVAKRLASRNLLDLVEANPEVSGRDKGAGRGRVVLHAADPEKLIEEWDQRRKLLDEIVPQLRAMHAKAGAAPRVRYLPGENGIRSALFDTLQWPSPLRGILSMRDLFTVPGPSAMREYIDARRSRSLWLHVVRSAEKDLPRGWQSSQEDLRRTRYAPADCLFTMTTFIGERAVVMLSSKQENFALKIESAEYAEMQRNLFEVLWAASQDTPEQ